MKIVLRSFRGMVPKVDEKRLAPDNASYCRNVKFYSGRLEGFTKPKYVRSIDWPGGVAESYTGMNTYFAYAPEDASGADALEKAKNYKFLRWSGGSRDVDAVRGPVPSDDRYRTYYTGDGPPKMTYATEVGTSNALALSGTDELAYPGGSRRLGVPTPENAVEIEDVPVIPADTLEKDIETRAYAVSLVTELSEEGPLSPPSADVRTVRIPTGVSEWAGFTAYVVGDVVRVGDEYPDDYYICTAAHDSVLGDFERGAPDQPAAINWRPYGVLIQIDTSHPDHTPNALDRVRIYRQATGDQTGASYLYVDEVDYAAGATIEFIDGKLTSELGEANPSLLWQRPPEDMHSLTEMANGFLVGASKNQVCVSEPNLPHAWNSLLRLNLTHDIVGIGAFATTAVVLTRDDAHMVTGTAPGSLSAVSARIRQGCVSKRGIVSVGHEGVIYPSPDGLFHISANGVAPLTAEFFERLQWQGRKPEKIVAAYRERMYHAFYSSDEVGAKHFIFDPALQNGSGMTILSEAALSGIEGKLDGVYNDPLTDNLFIFTSNEDGVHIHLFDADEDDDEGVEYRWESKVFDLQRVIGFRCMRADVVDGYLKVGFEVDGEDVHEAMVLNSEAVRLPPDKVRGRFFKLKLTGIGAVRDLVVAETLTELNRGVE